MMMKRNMRDHLHSFYNPVSHRAQEKQSDSFQMKSETSPSPKQINAVLASQRGCRLWIPYDNKALFRNKVRIWRSKDSWPRASPKNVQRGCRSLLAKVLKVKQPNQRHVTRSWNVKKRAHRHQENRKAICAGSETRVGAVELSESGALKWPGIKNHSEKHSVLSQRRCESDLWKLFLFEWKKKNQNDTKGPFTYFTTNS